MRWERPVRGTTTGITTLLLLALVVLCAAATLLCGGSTGLVVGLGGVVILNGAAYWCRDARPLRSGDAPWLRALVIELAGQARVPVPRIAVIVTPIPDALSTGRDPNHATILVTTGLACLDTRTLRGVLAHELAHIKGRDTLRSAVAMTLTAASAVAVVVEQIMALVGHPDADTLALLLVAPLAALLLQRALARTRPMRGVHASATMPPRCPMPCACWRRIGAAIGRGGCVRCSARTRPRPRGSRACAEGRRRDTRHRGDGERTAASAVQPPRVPSPTRCRIPSAGRPEVDGPPNAVIMGDHPNEVEAV